MRLTTRVFPDGGVQRRLEIHGRNADGTAPTKSSWMEEEAHLQLADRKPWSRVDERPGYLAAEGYFRSAEETPAGLAHITGAGAVADRVKLSLKMEDLVILRRWVYRETWSDVYGGAEASGALDRALDLACRALRGELRLQFGETVDPSRGEALLRGEGRAMIAEALAVRAKSPGPARIAERNRLWGEILLRHGIALAPFDEQHFWEGQTAGLLDWSRRKMAAALSTPDRPVGPDELSFWPAKESVDEDTKRIIERTWGSEDDFYDQVMPLLDALSGYYGGGGTPRFRFEARISLPGRLLRTNGTPDGDGVLWFFRDADLTSEERPLEIDAAQADDEKLRALGARRELETWRLIEIADILTERDPQGDVKKLLALAVERGRLALLRDKTVVGEETLPTTRELADLLDPAVQAP